MITITVKHKEVEQHESVDIDELVHRLVYIAIKYYHDDKIMASHMKDIIKQYIK